MMKWGGACQSSPIFHMAITPAQIRKTFSTQLRVIQGLGYRFRTDGVGCLSSSHSFVCEMPFLYTYDHCAHVCEFMPLGPPSCWIIPPNYCMISKMYATCNNHTTVFPLYKGGGHTQLAAARL